MKKLYIALSLAFLCTIKMHASYKSSYNSSNYSSSNYGSSNYGSSSSYNSSNYNTTVSRSNHKITPAKISISNAGQAVPFGQILAKYDQKNKPAFMTPKKSSNELPAECQLPVMKVTSQHQLLKKAFQRLKLEYENLQNEWDNVSGNEKPMMHINKPVNSKYGMQPTSYNYMSINNDENPLPAQCQNKIAKITTTNNALKQTMQNLRNDIELLKEQLQSIYNNQLGISQKSTAFDSKHYQETADNFEIQSDDIN